MPLFICTVNHDGRPNVTLEERHRGTTLDDGTVLTFPTDDESDDRVWKLDTFRIDITSDQTVFSTKDERLAKAVYDALKAGIVCGRAPDIARNLIAKAFEIGRHAGADSRSPSSK